MNSSGPETGQAVDGGGRQRRAWGSLNRDQIVACGLRIAREEGMQALTIRRLASELGASRMALYRHVPDKDGLTELVMDAIAEHDMVPPDIEEGPWEERLRRLAAGIRRELTAYPGLVDILMTRAHHGQGALRLVDSVLGILGDAGLCERQAVRHYLVFVDLVLGRCHRELHGDPVDHHRTASLTTLAEQAGDYARLRAAVPYLVELTPGQIFQDELDMLVLSIKAAARPT
ncbi:TetR/AcrR family transcriptional regulator [Streptomyces sp. YU58]|uniref:TetR/AcrR family transcriptional regulator n=1 Tax=Streptomyces sp. SX92 TaxID=3158972 RepID=UPI0027BA8FAC|nr:TetR/AcrR family transcriptional regulator C-terminal domain-containing protein [Streptomyces coralus]WLW50142.1 TetR/AcrR family transcriptional regulator C-terminal domain-containing protein [Streptomyces coralus]